MKVVSFLISLSYSHWIKMTEMHLTKSTYELFYSLFWWFVRVTLVVAFGFFLQNFGRWLGCPGTSAGDTFTILCLYDVKGLIVKVDKTSSSRIKSDSFRTKQLVVRPLCRSSRLSTSFDKIPTHSAAETNPAKRASKPPTPSASAEGTSKGTFTTQSYGLKMNKKT